MTEKQILELRTSMTDSTYSHIQVHVLHVL